MASSSRGEIRELARRLRADHPGSPLVCVLLRAPNVPLLDELYRVLDGAVRHAGGRALRPDRKLYAPDLWSNAQVYLEAADAGIAVFDDLPEPWRPPLAPNPRVSVELGYLLGLGKPVMLLRDRKLAALPVELTALPYRRWTGLDPASAAPEVRAWLESGAVPAAAGG